MQLDGTEAATARLLAAAKNIGLPTQQPSPAPREYGCVTTARFSNTLWVHDQPRDSLKDGASRMFWSTLVKVPLSTLIKKIHRRIADRLGVASDPIDSGFSKALSPAHRRSIRKYVKIAPWPRFRTKSRKCDEERPARSGETVKKLLARDLANVSTCDCAAKVAECPAPNPKLNDVPRPHFSVVTVVYNGAAVLERTIQSVCSQTYDNLEYVIVDGGSSDGSLDIIKHYQDCIDRWISEPDRGIYDAMNKGTRMSSGSWVNFMNAGDEFVGPAVVERIASVIEPDDDIIFGHTIFHANGKSKLVEARNLDQLWKAIICNHNSMFSKRELLLQHPFTDQYRIVADSEFLIWCHSQKRSFKNVGFTINTYESGGFSDQNSVMRTVERWKLVSDYKLRPQSEINEFYFQRLLREDTMKAHLAKRRLVFRR